ncbi:MAG: hypothetical protein JO060_03690 [Candidatus Eremiobacteraeota bacterium]|nr:hypothetical protein [Candidatus Eremiobacteraeota bacterium]
MTSNRLIGAGALFLVTLLISGQSARAAGAKLLYAFKHGSDGEYPVSELIVARNGAIYGTTSLGGAYNYGTIFELLPSGQEKLLHTYTGGADGGGPQSGLVADGKGNLYGTTLFDGPRGYGTLFKIAPNGTETVLHGFAAGNDGASPFDRPLLDRNGNLFGTTSSGGGPNCGSVGCGTVFEVTPDGSEKIIYSFLGDYDGESPWDSVIEDQGGNLYGTTEFGGGANWGTVFVVSPSGAEKVLHRFSPSTDGGLPIGGVVADRAGNLYGTTACCGPSNAGTVYKIARNGAFSVVHAFRGGTDGQAPYGLTNDDRGTLYGTTVEGGGPGCPSTGCGTIFKIAPNGTETVIYAFTEGRDGNSPYRSPLLYNGYLYVTAASGGTQGLGTVIKVKK